MESTIAVKVDYSNDGSFDYSQEIDQIVDLILDLNQYDGYEYVDNDNGIGSGLIKTGNGRGACPPT